MKTFFNKIKPTITKRFIEKYHLDFFDLKELIKTHGSVVNIDNDVLREVKTINFKKILLVIHNFSTIQNTLRLIKCDHIMINSFKNINKFRNDIWYENYEFSNVLNNKKIVIVNFQNISIKIKNLQGISNENLSIKMKFNIFSWVFSNKIKINIKSFVIDVSDYDYISLNLSFFVDSKIEEFILIGAKQNINISEKNPFNFKLKIKYID